MIIDFLESTLESWGLSPDWSPPLASAIALVGLAALALLIDVVSRRVLLRFFVRMAERTRADWDDELVRYGVLHQLAHLVPTLIVYLALPVVLAGWSGPVVGFLQKVALLGVAIVTVIAVNRALNASLAVYDRTQLSTRIPLRPFVQLLQGLVAFAVVILLVAMVINRSAAAILGGMGAFAAVLLLVFQQPILGLAAGIQLSANRMIRVGDWITVPKFGADGIVTEISLTSVSIQNWDKTISTVPSHSLLTDTFVNWRGMEESGGRRVKRAVLIDANTVQFMDDELRQRLGRLHFLRDYLEEREREIAEYNEKAGVDPSSPANGRRMTNLGTFRAYLERYLHAHPKVSDDLTFLVRQLDPTPEGIPLEIYVFLTEQRWAQYESIQSDIFDHVFAVIPEFGLRVFQKPAGTDLRSLSAMRSTG